MSNKLNLKDTKSPVTLIYGEVKNITYDRVKGKKVSWIEIQSLNRRIHKVLFYGTAPKQWLGDLDPRTFVVQEKTRVKTELIPFVPVSVQKAIGKDSTIHMKVSSKEGHKFEQKKDELKPSEVYIKHKETVTDLVLIDDKLNPQSI